MKYIKLICVLLIITSNVDCQEINWIKKSDIPIPISKAKAAVVNRKIYLMGGVTPTFRGFSKANYEYNPATDSWIKKRDMPTGRTNYAIAVVQDKIYVIGGDPFLNKIEVYDPKTDTWDTTLNCMPSKRQHINCATSENKIYVIGGFEDVCCPPYPQRCNWENCAKISNKNQVYNILADSWENIESLPTPRHGLDMTFVNGKIYVIGGMGNETSLWTPLKIVEVYDPLTDKWNKKQDMPIPRDGFGYSVQKDKIFLFGGWIADRQQSDVTVTYDTKTDIWSNSTNLPIRTGAFGYATIENKIYIFGGDKEDYSEIYSFTYVGEISE